MQNLISQVTEFKGDHMIKICEHCQGLSRLLTETELESELDDSMPQSGVTGQTV